jgi:hypothetical protein
MGTGSMKLTAYLHLVSRLRIHGAILPPPRTSLWRDALLSTFTTLFTLNSKNVIFSVSRSISLHILHRPLFINNSISVKCEVLTAVKMWIFCHEDGGSMFPRNVGIFLRFCRAAQPRIQSRIQFMFFSRTDAPNFGLLQTNSQSFR